MSGYPTDRELSDIIAIEAPMNWFDRWQVRQYQLASGVDADLVRDNQKRYRLAFGLLGIGFALGWLATKVHLPDTLRWIVSSVATVSLVAGMVLAGRARQQAGFLRKPDPEEPPKIFK
jgi:hypothetical protein